jgi:hypothetical protein
MTIPAINFPTSQDDNSTLFEVVNNLVTTLAANIDNVVASIDLSDASAFPSTGGFFSIGTEVIHYESKTGNTMNNCTRGADGSTATSHNIGDAVSMRVIAIHHNRLKDAIIALETWALGGGGGSGAGMIKEFNQNGHGFAVNDVVRFNGTIFVKAQADSVVNAEALGIVVEVVDVNNFKLQSGGFCENLSGFTAGTVYFLSDVTAGLLQSAEPTDDGTISKPLFIALSATTGYFFNFRGLQVGPSNSVYSSFTNADLTDNVLTITHNLGRKYVAVTIIDDNDNPVDADLITYVNDNSLTVDLTEYAPISGTWRYIVLSSGSPTTNTPALIQNDVADTRVEAKADKTIVETANSIQARKVNADGSQNLPAQPAFSVRADVVQSNIPNTGYTKMTLNNEIFDVGNNFDTVNSEFVAPVAGYYFVCGSVRYRNMDQGANEYRVRFKKGSGYGYSQNSFDPRQFAGDVVGDITLNISELLYLSAGESLQLHGYQIGGTAQTDIDNAFMSGVLVK